MDCIRVHVILIKKQPELVRRLKIINPCRFEPYQYKDMKNKKDFNIISVVQEKFSKNGTDYTRQKCNYAENLFYSVVAS